MMGFVQPAVRNCTKLLYEGVRSAVRSPFSRLFARAFWRLAPLKIKVSRLVLVYEAVCTSYHMGRAHRSHRWGRWFESNCHHAKQDRLQAVLFLRRLQAARTNDHARYERVHIMGQTKEASPRWGVPKASDLSLLARKGERNPLQGFRTTIERTDVGSSPTVTTTNLAGQHLQGFSYVRSRLRLIYYRKNLSP